MQAGISTKESKKVPDPQNDDQINKDIIALSGIEEYKSSMNVKSTLKPTAKKFFLLSLHANHLGRKTQLEKWNFTEKDNELIRCLLDEWYSGRTLSVVLQEWEEHNNKYLPSEKVPLNILYYNVEG